MLPKDERLRSNSEFSNTYRLKRSVANSLFVLYTGKLKNTLDVPVKAAFVVGKKVHKSSVKRNLIKRRMREAYRQVRQTLDFSVNQWSCLIFIARSGSVEADYKQIYYNIADCLKKANKKFGIKF